MAPYRECHLMLKIVVTVFITVVTAIWDQERQPVGPEMCKYHCGQFTGCTFCIFLIKKLACIATWAKYLPQINGKEAVSLNFNKERLGSVSERMELCEDRLSKMLLTRSNDLRCMKLRTEEKTQLLVAPGTKITKTPLLAFNLLNSSITTYHHIKPLYITAMAYVATMQQVLIATRWKIQSFSLHANVSVTLRRRMFVLSIAVDDARHLVFLAVKRPYTCITSMTLDGRYFKNITCQIRPYTLCLDTRREIVYVIAPKDVWSFTYNGQSRQWITTSVSTSVDGLTLGENGDLMHYIDNSNIMELELFKNQTGRKIGKVSFQVSDMIFNRGCFYMSSDHNKYIHVWRESVVSRLRGANPTGVTSQVIAFLT